MLFVAVLLCAAACRHASRHMCTAARARESERATVGRTYPCVSTLRTDTSGYGACLTEAGCGGAGVCGGPAGQARALCAALCSLRGACSPRRVQTARVQCAVGAADTKDERCTHPATDTASRKDVDTDTDTNTDRVSVQHGWRRATLCAALRVWQLVLTRCVPCRVTSSAPSSSSSRSSAGRLLLRETVERVCVR
eukprot:1951029-Rhodomonas_salina.1